MDASRPPMPPSAGPASSMTSSSPSFSSSTTTIFFFSPIFSLSNGAGSHFSPSKTSSSALTSFSIASSGAPCSALIPAFLASSTRPSRQSACAFRNLALTFPGCISSAASQSNNAAFAFSVPAMPNESSELHMWFSRCPHASIAPCPAPGDPPRARYAAALLQ